MEGLKDGREKGGGGMERRGKGGKREGGWTEGVGERKEASLHAVVWALPAWRKRRDVLAAKEVHTEGSRGGGDSTLLARTSTSSTT